VKARKSGRHATSDWLEIEKTARHLGGQLGDAVHLRRLRDQPCSTAGSPGFFEDTYRVLTAVDAAVMVVDAAKA